MDPSDWNLRPSLEHWIEWMGRVCEPMDRWKGKSTFETMVETMLVLRNYRVKHGKTRNNPFNQFWNIADRNQQF